jgi:hypothetical protein
MEKHTGLTAWIVILIIVSVVFLIVGFYKMYAYKNYESFMGTSDVYESYGRIAARVFGTTNAYVGGDAFNYIINAGYATAYFVLAMFSGLVATGLGIIKAIKQIKYEIQ